MWEVLGGLLVGTAVSGLIPVVNADILVLAAAAALPAIGVPLVALTSTLGQMTSKTSLFLVARSTPHRLRGRARSVLDSARETVERRGGAAGSLVYASAATGIPPFYGVSLATGALGMRLFHFCVAGSAGRFIRFGLLAWTGHTVGAGTFERISDRLVLPLFGG